MGRLKGRLLGPAQQLAWKRATSRSYPPPTGPERAAVVVHSFDGYKRFWPPMVFFTTQAIGSTIPVVYLTEETPMVPGARCLMTGPGGFGTRLVAGLESLVSEFEYILYLQEDMWLTERIDGPTLQGFVETMDRHRLDCLKLGWGSFWPDDKDRIASSTDLLPGDDAFRWFGPNRYALSHHCSIFRTRFLLDATRLAVTLRVESPLEQEVLVSDALSSRMKATNSDRGDVRIAVWDAVPPLSYVHAGENGRLTDEGRALLDERGVLELWDETLPGEVFPDSR